MDFRERLNSGFVVLDGATGTNLQREGMGSGDCPEQWIVEHPDVFIELQRRYIGAGSDVLYAPTFTGTSIKLAEYGLADRQGELLHGLVGLTKEAVRRSGSEKKIYVLGDISMTGQQIEPMGTLSFEGLVDIYKEEVSLLAGEGVDGFAIETMMSLQECRAALLAVKETCSLPVLVTLTFQEDGRTLYGTSPETAVVVMQSMGADAVGVNCSAGPDKIFPIVRRMSEVSNIPIVAKPNAGMPKLVGGRTEYDMDADDFSAGMMALVDAGATVLGGCCGTGPEHIKKLKDKLKNKIYNKIEKPKMPALTTERDVTWIELDGKFMLVGERINPTGKPALQNELRRGSLDLVLQMAEEQVEKGARVLDVNMGMGGIDEGEMMQRAVVELAASVDVPLSIDSSHAQVVERALRVYPGRALINSISLEPERIEKMLPLAKKYGAMFILLPLSQKGLPENMEEKKSVIRSVLAEAEKLGLSGEDVAVDGLVTAAGADCNAAVNVLETIRYCKEELHLATVCGLSNISFGLPERQFVNSAFLTLAIGGGLTMAIANPDQALTANAALAAELLLNRKDAGIRYIEGVRPVNQAKMASGGTGDSLSRQMQKDEMGKSRELEEHPLYMAVVKGKSGQVCEIAERELQGGGSPAELIDRHLIPAINRVGELFEKKKYFLPQLIASAETMEKAVNMLEPLLMKERGREKREVIVLATVKGDIHDIGKNLVALMLRNYGYDVIDMGKDVEAQDILDCAVEHGAAVIGLSALMTTTMTQMEHVIRMAKEQGIRAKIVVGGAVVTEGYAEEIGADGYSADAGEAVKLVGRLLSEKPV